jgi:hypothetical protein
MRQLLIFTCLLLLGCKQVSKEIVMLENMEDSSYEKKIMVENSENLYRIRLQIFGIFFILFAE